MFLCDLALAPDARRVEHREAAPLALEAAFDDVARRAGDLAHDGLVLAD